MSVVIHFGTDQLYRKMLMAITQGVHSVHQKVYQVKMQVCNFNNRDSHNDSQGFYVIQWTHTNYIYNNESSTAVDSSYL